MHNKLITSKWKFESRFGVQYHHVFLIYILSYENQAAVSEETEDFLDK